MEFYRGVVSPILDRLPSEEMHVLARDTLDLAEKIPGGVKMLEQFAYGRQRFSDERLRTIVGGVKFDNPVMVGAGWDKKGVAVQALWTLGFSGVEVGSVLRDPQPGKPKPRQFYHPRGTALNRLGFNSSGMDAVYDNVQRYYSLGIPYGISLGQNKEVESKDAPAAHAVVARRFMNNAYWFTINVSSPNTPGLRELQDKGPLTDIVQAVKESTLSRQPIFVKIAPDLTYGAIDDVIEVVVDNHLAGIIATNTTVDESLKARYGWRGEAGGLSGNDPDYRDRVTQIIAHIYRQAGDKLDIIGIGGVNSWLTAIEKIGAGAKAVQVVTAIREVGTTLPGRINRGLVEIMEIDGAKSISEYIGRETHKIPH